MLQELDMRISAPMYGKGITSLKLHLPESVSSKRFIRQLSYQQAGSAWKARETALPRLRKSCRVAHATVQLLAASKHWPMQHLAQLLGKTVSKLLSIALKNRIPDATKRMQQYQSGMCQTGRQQTGSNILKATQTL